MPQELQTGLYVAAQRALKDGKIGKQDRHKILGRYIARAKDDNTQSHGGEEKLNRIMYKIISRLEKSRKREIILPEAKKLLHVAVSRLCVPLIPYELHSKRNYKWIRGKPGQEINT